MKKVIRLDESDLLEIVTKVLKEQQSLQVREKNFVKGFSSFPEGKFYKSVISRDGDILKVFPYEKKDGLGNTVFSSKMKGSIPELEDFGETESFKCIVKRKGNTLGVSCPMTTLIKNKRLLSFSTSIDL